MYFTKRLTAILICALLCAPALLAQDRKAPSRANGPTAQDVTIIIQQEQVRFTAQKTVQMMQLQVFNPSGEAIFDSGPVPAGEINWPFQNANGEELKSGHYAYTLSIHESGAAEARVRSGHFIVDRVKDRDGKTDKLWVTSRSEDDFGTELIVARNKDGAIAGTKAGAQAAGEGLLADEIPEGQVVKKLNGLTDDVTLEAGTNVAITSEGNTLKIESQVGDGQVVKGLNGLTDQITLEAGPNITITPNGNALTIAATGVGNSSVTELNGNVGIGTDSPVSKLDVRGRLTLDPGFSPVLFTAAAGGEQNRFLQLINSPDYRSASGLMAGGVLVSDNYNFAQPGKNNLVVKGNIGIGTPSPLEKLHVIGGARFETPGSAFSIGSGGLFSTTNSITLRSTGSAGNNHIILQPPVGGILNPVPGAGSPGNVGIGTTNPQYKLQVTGNGVIETRINSNNSRAVLSLSSIINGQNSLWSLESGLANQPGWFGIYDVTRNAIRLRIDQTGLVVVKALQIEGGADFAENFDVSEALEIGEATTIRVNAGLVVSIDPTNPGKLQISEQAYDRRVAGIISGAGGVKPGMMMSQAGTLADGQHPVALSGRVYCWVDASQGAIEPGDLLTTSATPGHAMKAVDPAKAQGAIIGKAMTGLKEGKGLVLVLVTLQ
ncbi:MAG TPA: hypothetical protein VJ810_32425 [Blastocatellia bacterium]|nr:hypothetical protein [Blastocatellia bacterium]